MKWKKEYRLEGEDHARGEAQPARKCHIAPAGEREVVAKATVHAPHPENVARSQEEEREHKIQMIVHPNARTNKWAVMIPTKDTFPALCTVLRPDGNGQLAYGAEEVIVAGVKRRTLGNDVRAAVAGSEAIEEKRQHSTKNKDREEEKIVVHDLLPNSRRWMEH
jgi:hypothetical protein